ncbi:MAG: ABC transporter permease [Clostridia bacterium]|nr:ABC transporter permease [Clostridia bacterium]
MRNDEITVIGSKRRLFGINLKELWRYRDLVMLFVKRDLKNFYKQTVLGPLWIIIKPFLSTFVFTIIFGIIANISTEGVPQFLFFMSGNIVWGLFSSCLSQSSSTFIGNARLFGKVYFPRLVMPISGIVYNFVNFLLQFAAFFILTISYVIIGKNVQLNIAALLTPLLMLQISLLGTGFGLLISSVTAKYRDLNILVSFGLSLWMYLTPVVYPSSQVPQSLRPIFLLNPVAPIIETFRFSFLGCGTFEWFYLLISVAVTAIVVFFGIIVFNQVEKDFIDTV